jgi:hypothetical protein
MMDEKMKGFLKATSVLFEVVPAAGAAFGVAAE